MTQPDLATQERIAHLWDAPTLSPTEMEEVRDWQATRWDLCPDHSTRAEAVAVFGPRARAKKAGMPTRYVGTTFDQFTETAENKPFRKATLEFLDGWFSGERAHYGLCFFGPTGSGKTFLMSIIADAFTQHGIAHIWRDVSDWLDAIRASIGDKHSDSMTEIRPVAYAPVLFLDDLGKEDSTDFAKAKIVQLLDSRYKEMLPTFISTNLSPGARPFKASGSGLEVHVGQRIFSRLHEMLKFAGPFPAKDWRR